MIVFNKLFIFTFLFMAIATHVSAADKMIFLNLENIKNLDTEEVSYVRKSAIEAITFSKKFNLILAKIDKSKISQTTIWYEAKIEIDKQSKFESSMRMSLIEMPSGLLVNLIREPKVNNLKLQYRARINILRLLFGKNVDEETGEILKDEIVPLNQYVNEAGESIGGASGGSGANSSDPKDPKIGEKGEPLELDPDEETKEDEPRVNKTQTVAPQAKNSDREKKLPPKKHPVTIANFQSPNLDLTKEPIRPLKARGLATNYTFSYSAGIEKEYIESANQFASNERLDLVVSLDRFVAGFGFIAQQEESFGRFAVDVALSQNVGENIYGVAPKNTLAGSYQYDFYAQRIFAEARAEFETSGYINIRDRGAGIENISSKLLWVGLGALVNFNIFGKEFTTEAFMMKTFMGNSDLGVDKSSVKMDGNKFHVTASTKVYKNFGIEFAYESVDISSMVLSKVETKHSVTSVKLIYN